MKSQWCLSLGYRFFHTPPFFLCCSRPILIGLQQEGASKGQSWSRDVGMVLRVGSSLASGISYRRSLLRPLRHRSCLRGSASQRLGEAKSTFAEAQKGQGQTRDVCLGKQRLLSTFNLEMRRFGNDTRRIF